MKINLAICTLSGETTLQLTNPMKKILTDLKACGELIVWCEKNKITTLAEAWAKCERGDWMLWLAAKRGLDRKKLVFIACQCARTSLKYYKDFLVLKCIETSEAWTRDEVSIEYLKVVRNNAYAAYGHVAYADAADASDASDAVALAADDAASTAACAAAFNGAAAYVAARNRARKACAYIVRKYLPEAP